MKRLISLIVLFSLILTSCAAVNAASLSDGIKPSDNVAVGDVSEIAPELCELGINLLREGYLPGENTLISPLSVISALAMCANGAEGDTLSQMEALFGVDTETLNAAIKDYTATLTSSEKYKLSLANSVWFTDDERFTVNENFLQTNADYYGADIFKLPFDSAAKRAINGWVNEKTDGMIPKIIDNIPSDAIMYLVNALAFEAEWSDVYEKHQVSDAVFTTENGTERTVKMMYSDEYTYLEDENAIGFMKAYSGRKYAFAAMLPNEGISISEYLEALTGESLYSTLSNQTHTYVNAGLPRFEFEYATELSGVLSALGMTDSFDPILADFTSLGASSDGNIFIGRVIHKTYISVGERGTKAGAATLIEMKDGAAPVITDPKTVILDRPFVFMLIDTETMLPFFIGTVTDIK